jgi:hypothetical protein
MELLQHTKGACPDCAAFALGGVPALAGALYANGPSVPFIVVSLVYLLITLVLALHGLVSKSRLRAAEPENSPPEPGVALPA